MVLLFLAKFILDININYQTEVFLLIKWFVPDLSLQNVPKIIMSSQLLKKQERVEAFWFIYFEWQTECKALLLKKNGELSAN